jgi:2-keto-3-deoxy-L-fuconate dehydrogenase
MRLAGKRAFVTAAGQGIGRAIAAAYLREGATVVATDLRADLLDGLEGARTQALDVTDKAALTAAIHAAAPDILVNCAGFVHAGTILHATDAEFDFAFGLNVRSQFHAMQAALPGMIERGGGSIINIASVAGSIVAAPNRCIYGASKAAVIGMTKSVALDFVTKGVRVNAICPGTVDSPSLHDRLRAMGDYEAAYKAFVARQPMGRIGTPDEVAHLAVYLGSDESAFTTGQAHVIDGGWATG